MAKKLTEKAVENIKPGSSRQEVPDALMKGLYLVVQPSGAKSWAVRYRFADKPRKLTLGRYPALGLKEARDVGAKALREVAEGNDPAHAKVEHKKQDDSVGRHFTNYQKRHLAGLRRGNDVAQAFERDILPAWRDRNIHEIRKRDVIALIDGIADRGSPIAANRTLAYLRAFLNWLESRDVIEVGPAKGIKAPAPERKRDRVLGDHEIRWLWAATGEMGQPFGPLVRLLLLTGQRRGEIAGLTDDDITDDAILIPASRAKNKKSHQVALTDLMREQIDVMVRIGPYLFTTTGHSPVSGFTKAHLRAARLMQGIAEQEVGASVEIPPWTWHDLRRTMASGLARLNIAPHVTEAVQNRATGAVSGVAAVYNRYDYAGERREAVEVWSRFVRDLVEGGEDNVIRMEAGA